MLTDDAAEQIQASLTPPAKKKTPKHLSRKEMAAVRQRKAARSARKPAIYNRITSARKTLSHVEQQLQSTTSESPLDVRQALHRRQARRLISVLTTLYEHRYGITQASAYADNNADISAASELLARVTEKLVTTHTNPVFR